MFKKTLGLLKPNFKPIILFDLLVKVLLVTLVVPVAWGVFVLSLKVVGIDYIGNDTLGTYLKSPSTWVVAVVVILLAAVFNYIEISGIVTAIHKSKSQSRVTVGKLMGSAVMSAKKMILSRNFGMIFVLLLLLPLTQALPVTGIVSTLTLPEFISDFIKANTILVVLLSVVILVLTILAIRWIFVFNRFSLTDETFKQSAKSSSKLIKGNYLKTIFKLILFGLFEFAVSVVLIVAISLIAMIFIQIFCDSSSRHDVAVVTFGNIARVVNAVVVFLGSIGGFAFIGAMYYDLCEEKSVEPSNISVAEKPMKNSHSIVISVLSVAMICVFVGSVAVSPSFAKNVNSMRIMSVAHRGYSTIYPENNIPAFENAIRVGADYIELDVHQTKDGVVVVTHDASIKRIAGVDKNVYDLTFDELESYDVGSWFSPDYKDLRVATLDQVMKLCKDKINVQIELKPTGNEPNFEQNVVDVVKKNDMQEQCLFGSMSADCLKTIKKLDPSLKTLYIMMTAVGNMKQIDFADSFSIEDSFVDEGLIDEIHSLSKTCFVWTLNTEETMNNAVSRGVDGIVSDDPTMVQKVVERKGNSELVFSIADLIYGKK